MWRLHILVMMTSGSFRPDRLDAVRVTKARIKLIAGFPYQQVLPLAKAPNRIPKPDISPKFKRLHANPMDYKLHLSSSDPSRL